MFGYEMMKDKIERTRNESQKLSERSGVDTGSEEDVFLTDYPSDYNSEAPESSDEDRVNNFKQSVFFGLRF
jgi:hypothetical protein